MLFFTSDLHFNHDKEFVYKARGFDSVEDMNRAIIERWNSVVSSEDDVYVLGDLMLGDNEKGLRLIAQLNGKLHIMLGNHDTATRETLYTESCDNVYEVKYATVIKYGKFHFYLSHYPTLTAYGEHSKPSLALINLFGHTHQKDCFFNGNPFVYHVGMDAHDCRPVPVEKIIEDVKKQYLCQENKMDYFEEKKEAISGFESSDVVKNALIASVERDRRIVENIENPVTAEKYVDVLRLIDMLREWQSYVGVLNECAYSDSMLENARKLLIEVADK